MKNILTETDFDTVVQRIGQLNSNSYKNWGVMRVEQMLAHCSDQIRLALGERQPHEKPTFINRNIGKYLGLWLPRIPLHNLKAPVDMNQHFFGTAPADVETEKTNLLQLLKEVRSFQEGAVLQTHPMYGRLNRKQWGRFMYVHLDHHLRQFSV